MKRIIRLTESDLTRIVRRVIMEQDGIEDPAVNVTFFKLDSFGYDPENIRVQGYPYAVKYIKETGEVRNASTNELIAYADKNLDKVGFGKWLKKEGWITRKTYKNIKKNN